MDTDLPTLPGDHLLGLQHREHDALRMLLALFEETATTLLERPDERAESMLDILCLLHYLGRAENHHLREEQVLFPALEERGVDPALLERLREQHQALWELQQELRERAKQEDLDAAAEPVARLARKLTATMRAHLQLEDRVLFPLALEVIPPSAWDALHERGRELPVRCLAPSRPDVA